MKKIITTLLSIACLIPSLNAWAVEFKYSSRFPDEEASGKWRNAANELTISGKIERGDTEKFYSFLRENRRDALFGFSTIELDSPGGDVIEAMKLAQAIKEFYPDIYVSGTCTSSCVLLWLAGGQHVMTKVQTIGIHRPYFEKEYFAKLPMHEAEVQYDKLSEQFKSYVLKQGLPQSIYEKLISTPSDKIYWLTVDDYILIGISPPAYNERYKSECGSIEEKHARKKCRNTILSPERSKALDKVFEIKITSDKLKKVYNNDEKTVYADPTSIRRHDNVVTMVSLMDFKKEQKLEGGPMYLTLNVEAEYDCDEKQSRLLRFVYYSGNMGGGKLLWADNATSLGWSAVTPIAGRDHLLKIACGKL